MENEEVKGTGEEVQDAAENNQDINWAKARESMAEQSQTIKALQSELQSLREVSSQYQQKQDSVDDDELITTKDLKKALSEKEKAYNEQLLELKARAKYQDFEEVLTKYGKKLPEAVRSAVMNSQDPFAAAYEACKSSADYYKDQISATQHEYAKKAEENLKKPSSASSVGGAGSLSKDNIYKSMSLADIRALAEKRASGG